MGETNKIMKDGPSPLSKPLGEMRPSSAVSSAMGVLKGVPGLEVKERRLEPKWAAYQLDLSLLFIYGQKKFRVVGEVKTNGEPSILHRSAAWLKEVLEKTGEDYAVIVAPFVSKEGAEICRELGVGFIDLSGNCLINLEGFYIERTGHPNKFKKPKEIQRLFSPKASRVVRCLLTNPGQVWTLKELATETGVSIGLVHRIATALESDLFAEKKVRAFKLEDPARLLEAWREDYYRRRPKWSRYVVRVRSIENLATALKTTAEHCGVRYGLSGPSGASLISPYMVPSVVHFYVDFLKAEFIEGLKAEPVSSEGNLLIKVVEQENEFIGSRQVNSVYVVSDLQLYLDLWAIGGRGQEAAEELRRDRLRF